MAKYTIDSIEHLQDLIKEAIHLMESTYKEKDREFWYKEYRRLKKLYDSELDEYAKGLLNFDII